MPAYLKVLPGSLIDNSETRVTALSVTEVEREIREHLEASIETARTSGESFMAFEKALVMTVRILGRLLILLFLTVREERERARTPQRIEKEGCTFRRRPAQPRNLDTFFGVVRYFRTYMQGRSQKHGYHPLDVAVGLSTDRLSMNLLSLAARMATMLSFARVHMTLGWFLGTSPSTEVIENTVLGLGRRTGEWFERAPPPENDGEVLIMQFDSKGAPTATQTEIERRRGKRRPNPFPNSPRHRGRDRRQRYGSKPRRKKGDKSKNAKMATIVVMYTLRHANDGTGWLLGPINRFVYSSFAPKKHVFEIARREADKRGFTKDSGKLVQIVTDGDPDLETYVQQVFPEAIHTVDVMHVIEYIYEAGACFFREGSDDLGSWIDEQKERLYGGKERDIVEELKYRLAIIPATGPGNKGKRERLGNAIAYLDKRLSKMNYQDLLARDLEIGSGAVEGAVKNIIGARFDLGGSRWIRERAEALLQLRCIEMNGHWDDFIQWVHDDHQQRALQSGERIRVQRNVPSALPKLAVAA